MICELCQYYPTRILKPRQNCCNEKVLVALTLVWPEDGAKMTVTEILLLYLFQPVVSSAEAPEAICVVSFRRIWFQIIRQKHFRASQKQAYHNESRQKFPAWEKTCLARSFFKWFTCNYYFKHMDGKIYLMWQSMAASSTTNWIWYITNLKIVSRATRKAKNMSEQFHLSNNTRYKWLMKTNIWNVYVCMYVCMYIYILKCIKLY